MMMKKTILLPILSAAFLTGGQLSVNAGELRPFVLPSTVQQSAPAQTYQKTQKPTLVSPTIYDKFAADVANMSGEQKNKLRDRYRQLLKRAEKNGNQAEISYYNELLAILAQD
jgi:hypothetical protein